ncbi:peptide deformylase [uncultured Parvibaculum sp.]|uniref:peptide deformylase n=1 Tax=uncultured Parvibaculum sp. TaxID=291828 RepID=UPI0030DB55DB|tara:strand:+ start:143635 stop:144159 length:525 start_codon:yes stop_codon:yes gene_type:complete
MAIREIITAPDPRLKQVSKPVERVDDALRALMDDMLETMYAAPGIGLAAIQVGVPKQVIVMDLAREGEKPQPRYFVNPDILWTSDDTAVYEEGCLSVPDMYEDVERPARCRVRYLDYQGEIREEDCDELLATCLQHEMDHLKGILFIDHLSRIKRSMMLKKLIKQKKLQEKEPA